MGLRHIRLRRLADYGVTGKAQWGERTTDAVSIVILIERHKEGERIRN